MRKMTIFLFSLFGLILLDHKDLTVFAKAPATAKIVFSANRTGNRDIYLMNPDGTEQINLTQHPADDISPTFSPTGEKIAFSSGRDNKAPQSWDLYLMDPDGTNVQKIFQTDAVRTGPTWSPDGQHIAYRIIERGQHFIYMATIDGRNEERLAIGHGPAWSPDGTEIAFVSGALERKQITILNLRTRKAKILFPRKANPSWIGSSPAWSPTGDKIAFSWLHRVPLKDFLETETIYIMNRDGTGLMQVVDEAGPRATSPVWSPLGDELLYVQAADVQAAQPILLQIFKMKLEGGGSEQLTDIGLGHHLGSWFDPAYALPVPPQPQLLTTTWGDVKKR